MAYMLMLVVEDPDRADRVPAAWHDLGVHDLTLVESACYHGAAAPRGRPPLHFVYEGDGQSGACSITYYAVVPDEAALQRCVAAAEVVLGDLDTAPNALLAAWPLTMVKGYPKRRREEGA